MTESEATAERQRIRAVLENELGEAATAGQLTDFIIADVLQWKPRLLPPSEVNTIVAYSFGNRIDANGNRAPGPVNEALAEVVVRLHAETDAPVYAQWEIAEAVAERVPSAKLVSIQPMRNALAETVYLSTGGVADAIGKRLGNGDKLGNVAVVAFSDHIRRCVDTSCRAGMNAGAPSGYIMPSTYDTLSGQPWTRSRLVYLLHDLHCRALDKRDQLLGSG